MNNKKTLYYDKSIEEIERIKKTHKRPTLGIHICCGPCSMFPLEFLTPIFKVVILFANSNIFPSEEYYRRLNELKKYVDIFNLEHHQDVEIVEFAYQNKEFTQCLEPHKDDYEGGFRCHLCYEKRMRETYKYANDHNFDYFTTVMTISRQKDSYVLNEIGEKLSHEFNTKYFYSDFKKKRGIDRGIELRKQYNLYNQEYCGCVYSYKKYLEKIEK